MMNKKEAYKAIARAVEVLEDDGINVEKADVEEIPEGNPVAQLFGGETRTTSKGIIVIDDFESPKQEVFRGDPPDWYQGDGDDAEDYVDEEESEETEMTDINVQ